MQNSSPLRTAPLPSGWRRFQFPALTLNIPTHLQRDHALRLRNPPAAGVQLSTYWPPWNKSNSKTNHVWPGVQKDYRTWARACMSCQRLRISSYVTTPLGDFAFPTSRFQHVHVDIVSPLPTSESSIYCLTAVDRFTF